LPHVFERFRQADSSRTREQGGLGLGLSIVHHLVQLHGGTARADSEGLGKGATFTIALPSLVVASVDDADAREEGARGADFDLHGVRVLVIDDDADARSCSASVSSDSALRSPSSRPRLRLSPRSPRRSRTSS
jgi:hypothetical protein